MNTPPTAPHNTMKVYYADDPDLGKAGQGLATAPFLDRIIDSKSANYWLMSPAEQMAMIYLLENLRPKVAIEIGTRFGGSLQVLAKFSERVYSLDIDPEVPMRMGNRFPNVEYLIGDSQTTLPKLLKKLQSESAELSFVLVDGDHTSDGVRADINALLAFNPVVPLYIVMHDSLNPDCRQGLRTANWADSPYVQAVALDFVMGAVNPAPHHRGELWGGLALGIVTPEARTGRMEVVGLGDMTFARSFREPLLKKIKRQAKRILKPSGK